MLVTVTNYKYFLSKGIGQTGQFNARILVKQRQNRGATAPSRPEKRLPNSKRRCFALGEGIDDSATESDVGASFGLNFNSLIQNLKSKI